MIRSDSPQLASIAPYFPRLWAADDFDEQVVPLLTTSQLVLLQLIDVYPRGLLELDCIDSAFSDAQKLRELGLIDIERRTDRLTITPEGREWLGD